MLGKHFQMLEVPEVLKNIQKFGMIQEGSEGSEGGKFRNQEGAGKL